MIPEQYENKGLDLRGLQETRMSGGSQFCLGQRATFLFDFLKKQGRPIIVDLRLESHGFIDEQPISWFCPRNWERVPHLESYSEALSDFELNDFNLLRNSHTATVYSKTGETPYGPKTIAFNSTLLESKVVVDAGMEYARLYWIDHRRPTDAQVEELVRLFSNLENDHWLHFHCKAGHGRTTTAMIMRDMYLNAHNVSIEIILKRQHVLGDADLTNVERHSGTYKHKWALERRDFLFSFYEFCKLMKAHPNLSWSEFSESQLTWMQRIRRWFSGSRTCS